jgi:hypothetical protein
LLRAAREKAARRKDATVTKTIAELATTHYQLQLVAGQRRSPLLAALAALLFGHFHMNLTNLKAARLAAALIK